jgi:hypothetical protein
VVHDRPATRKHFRLVRKGVVVIALRHLAYVLFVSQKRFVFSENEAEVDWPIVMRIGKCESSRVRGAQ